MTLETLITLLTIENNIIRNYFVTFILSVTGTAFSILEMFEINVLNQQKKGPRWRVLIAVWANLLKKNVFFRVRLSFPGSTENIVPRKLKDGFTTCYMKTCEAACF